MMTNWLIAWLWARLRPLVAAEIAAALADAQDAAPTRPARVYFGGRPDAR